MMSENGSTLLFHSFPQDLLSLFLPNSAQLEAWVGMEEDQVLE
jgi:hypothetical protein